MFRSACCTRWAAAVALLFAAAPAVAGDPYDDSDFATEVVEYIEGTGVGSDWLSGDPFTDATTAVGRPTVDTTGDGWYIPPGDPVPVVPVYPAFRSFELVTVGTGGHLILGFDHPVLDHPRNPYGLDLVVFGNSFQVIGGEGAWTNGDPEDTVMGGGGFAEPGTVSVSQDGLIWYTFQEGPFADDFGPTLGRVYDPEAPDESLGEWNQWWGQPTDPTIPLDPWWDWSTFVGHTVADMAEAYDGSAGGTGFDLAWLDVPDLEWIRYVRIESPASGGTTEVDAVSDVFPLLGDFGRDGDVDLADFGRCQECWTGSDTGPRPAGCLPADADGDGDVDHADHALFISYLTGPTLP